MFMEIARILKFAFIMSLAIYGVVAWVVAGAPDWSRPVLPEVPGSAPLLVVLALMALSGWGAGIVLGRLSDAPGILQQNASRKPWPVTRFVLAAALLESGAIAGLVLSLLNKDSRFALGCSAVTAVLLLMTPASDGSRG
jgi:F0F1-type ATP synthase membrane subunit c/vacuolar-type H+-ATPase subunit K